MNEEDFIRKRYRLDLWLRRTGLFAVIICCCFIICLFTAVIFKSYDAFFCYKIKFSYNKIIDIEKTNEQKNLEQILSNFLGSNVNPYDFFSNSVKVDLDNVKEGKVVLLAVSDKLNNFLDGNYNGRFSEEDLELIDRLQKENLIKKDFNFSLFTAKESRDPQNAGILTSLVGSIYTMLICMIFSIPIAIFAAIYLEEFSKKSLLTTLIEININNLAAVPSIVFGLIGLSLFINFFEMPRSSAIVAGLTLSLMVLPTIIITTRNSIKSVPIAIKHAALALGATKIQVIFHYTLPLSIPGITTGVILSIARAIGETAPLILIGMVAFIVDIPKTIFDPTTVLPVQIFLWADSPEYGFEAKTSAAILLLLSILVMINLLAVYIRRKYENRW